MMASAARRSIGRPRSGGGTNQPTFFAVRPNTTVPLRAAAVARTALPALGTSAHFLSTPMMTLRAFDYSLICTWDDDDGR
jgi:hypothetical protein